MPYRRNLLLAASASALSGCASWTVPVDHADQRRVESYGYQPLDPTPVRIRSAGGRGAPTRERLLAALPDETMRMAIGEVSAQGSVTFGPIAIAAENRNYVVTIDYMKSNTIPVPVARRLQGDSEVFTALAPGSSGDAALPVYVGVGLRLTVNLIVLSGRVNLGNLTTIGAAAQANQIVGTLVVQTLGISGETISTALPIPNEISPASIQAAIQALGTMKAKIYDAKTEIHPRVAAIYNSLGGGRVTIDGVVSAVLQNPPPLEV